MTLGGTIVVSDKPVHVWSGNEGAQRTVEQLLAVSRWGQGGTYVIVSPNQPGDEGTLKQ